ncbi:MAG: DNA-formamidopyrimidine glycosylase [Bacilli bacterium]|nr:DNA-formamidopyrimidine glycosylase [Bacilli bacterium]
MPELPEVETVKNTLKKLVLGKTINNVNILYDSIIEYPTIDEFKNNLVGETIQDIKRRGKWLMFILNNYVLLSHLRMEGKYVIRNVDDEYNKHEHVEFVFSDLSTLRYKDTRKFGRMYLYKKEDVLINKPLNELGLEPWDDSLNVDYLKEKFKDKRLPLKTLLLDQSIIVGLGNIYVDEVLFLSKLNPEKKTNALTRDDLKNIIDNTRSVLEHAIKLGGTTIRTYESSEGVHGLFQNELLIHGKDKCPICGCMVTKIRVGGRGTYYCKNCQK